MACYNTPSPLYITCGGNSMEGSHVLYYQLLCETSTMELASVSLIAELPFLNNVTAIALASSCESQLV